MLLTHLHGDHVGGLITANGQRAFPNSVVRVARAEHDYWMGTALPKNYGPMIAMTQAARKDIVLGRAHLAFPGLGQVKATGQAFAWVPQP